MPEFCLKQLDKEQCRLVIDAPAFNFDNFAPLALSFVQLIGASVLEQQQDADLHTWLIDFEGCQLMLRGEHYSESMWLEGLSEQQGREELVYLAGLLQTGI